MLSSEVANRNRAVSEIIIVSLLLDGVRYNDFVEWVKAVSEIKASVFRSCSLVNTFISIFDVGFHFRSENSWN